MGAWSADTPRPPKRLWFAIVGAPLAWGVQGLLSWIVSEEACLGAQGREAPTPGAGLRLLEIGIFAAALAVAVAAAVIAVREWRAAPDREISAGKTMDRSRFLQAVALFVSFSFALGVLLLGLGAFWLPGCERMR